MLLGLPLEVLEMILRRLPQADLLNMSLVSKYTNMVVSRPALWTGVRLAKRTIRERGILQVFRTKFRQFKSLHLPDCRPDDYKPLFQYLVGADNVHIEHISFHECGPR